MKKYVIIAYYIILLFYPTVYAFGSSHRIGNAFIVNYPASDYQSGRQVWDICEGGNGLMYFATGPLLESGNNYWKIHELNASSPTRSVCSMPGNDIMVGGPGMIGVMKLTDLPGHREFYSLMDRLDTVYHDFGTIWQILSHHQAFYIRAGKGVFKFENDTIVPLLYGKLVDNIHFSGDSLFIHVVRQGIGVYIHDAFMMMPFGDKFTRSKVVGVFPANANDYLIFTAEDGVYQTVGDNIKPYDPFNLPEFREGHISAVTELPNGMYAIGTIKNGLFILDRQGVLIQHINRKSGLQNNTIISMMADSNGNLWLGLDNGISYVELSSCLSVLSSDTDIGTGYISKYFQGNMYFGTNQGLYYARWNLDNPLENRQLNIKPVANTTGQVWTLFVAGDRLFCGHHKGLLEINGTQSIEIGELEGCWQIDYMDNQNDVLLVSTYRGFFLLQFDNNLFVKQTRITNIPSNPRVFLQDSHGYFWIVTPEQRIYRFLIDLATPERAIRVEDMTDINGMEAFSSIRLVGNKRQVFFSTDHGLYNYDFHSQVFVRNDFYNQIIETGEMCFELFEDDYNRIWYGKNSEMGFFPLHFGSTKKTFLPFNKILDSYTRIFGKINVVDAENILFGVENGFYHYHSHCMEVSNVEYRAYIAELITNTDPEKWFVGNRGGKNIPVFRHNRNAFEFFFTSNFFETKKNVHYSYMLEGYDAVWSEWQTRNSRGYSNLLEGTYILRLRAQSIGGQITGEASFTFIVEPPFYRSRVAYMLYLIILVIIIIFGRFLINKHLKKEKEKVEAQKQYELEQRKKVYEAEQLLARQRITELENEKLHQDLVHKSKELSNSMLSLIHMNDNLRKIKSDVQLFHAEKDEKKRDNQARYLLRFINSEISTPKYMELFDLNFSAVHEEFILTLQDKYPQLSQNDIKLCAFLKMNKSTKEIASLMNISIRGVETSRHRLRKKMGLSRDENLYNFIATL